MRSFGGVWRQHLSLWLPPLVFFLLATGALVTYWLAFAGEAAISRERVEEQQQRLTSISAERQRLAALLERIESNRRRVEGLYDQNLATERRRLTSMIREVRRLADNAGLSPRQVSYPQQSLEAYGLTKRSFVFTVEGTYNDLRELINTLELSDFFLTLEEVALSEITGAGGSSRLTISLRLSTLFAESGSAASEAVAEEESS